MAVVDVRTVANGLPLWNVFPNTERDAIRAYALTGPDAVHFGISETTCGPSLAAGGGCSWGFNLPTAEGRRSATLSIPAGGSANAIVPVALTGTGCVADGRQEPRIPPSTGMVAPVIQRG